MKILVLGSEGQIGSNFCEYAISKGHEIIRWDKTISSEHNLARDCFSLHSSLGPYILASDAILFLAYNVGGAKYQAYNDKMFDYISENVQIMENTFTILRNINKPVLFASSQMSNMYDTNYGLLKQLGERYTKACNNIWTCRFWNVYGVEDPTSPKSHVITDFIYQAETTKKIVMRTNGEELRQFMHASDASKALLYWCNNYESLDRNKYLDITTGYWNSIKSIAQTVITNILGASYILGPNKDLQTKYNPHDPYFMKLAFANDKFIKIEDGIKDIICQMKARTYLSAAAQDL